MSLPTPNLHCQREPDAASWAARAYALRSPLTALQVTAGLCGAAAFGYWWMARGLSPRVSVLLWAATLLLWTLAFFSPWPISRPTSSTAWTVAIITLLMIPRSLSLASAPYGITFDEALHPLSGMEVLREKPWETISGAADYFSTPYLTQVLQAWPCLLFEPLFGARLATVLQALASLLLTYAFAARLFGRPAGMGAAVLLSCWYWHMAYSRMAYPYMQPILIVPLSFYVLLRGVDERHRCLQFIGGVLIGVSVLVYTPARIVVPVFFLWLAHRVWTKQLRLRDAALDAAVIILGAAIFLSPYLRAQGFSVIMQRYVFTTTRPQSPLHLLSAEGWASPAGRQQLAAQLHQAAQIYYKPGAWMAVDDGSPTPLLDAVSLALVLIGLGVALAHVGDSAYFLLVVWIAATFFAGQVLTDVPYAAYRAAPALPALAMCAGEAAARIIAWAQRWRVLRRPSTAAVGIVALIAVVLPPNLRALRAYLGGLDNPGSAMPRLVGAGSTAPVYYLVASGPVNHIIFDFVAAGRTMRNLSSLMDSLGGADIDTTRDAVFVLEAGMTDALAAIRRCYPGGVSSSAPAPAGWHTAMAFYVAQTSVVAGRNCNAPASGPGLSARYFSGDHWDGVVTRSRVEDWPTRWMTAQDAAEYGSVEWSGWLRIPVGGNYRFQLLAGASLATAMVGTQVQLEPQHIAGAAFEPGDYPVLLRCQSLQGDVCWLRWAPPGGDFGSIPPEFFKPSTDSPSPGNN